MPLLPAKVNSYVVLKIKGHDTRTKKVVKSEITLGLVYKISNDWLQGNLIYRAKPNVGRMYRHVYSIKLNHERN